MGPCFSMKWKSMLRAFTIVATVSIFVCALGDWKKAVQSCHLMVFNWRRKLSASTISRSSCSEWEMKTPQGDNSNFAKEALLCELFHSGFGRDRGHTSTNLSNFQFLKRHQKKGRLIVPQLNFISKKKAPSLCATSLPSSLNFPPLLTSAVATCKIKTLPLKKWNSDKTASKWVEKKARGPKATPRYHFQKSLYWPFFSNLRFSAFKQCSFSRITFNKFIDNFINSQCGHLLYYLRLDSTHTRRRKRDSGWTEIGLEEVVQKGRDDQIEGQTKTEIKLWNGLSPLALSRPFLFMRPSNWHNSKLGAVHICGSSGRILSCQKWKHYFCAKSLFKTQDMRWKRKQRAHYSYCFVSQKEFFCRVNTSEVHVCMNAMWS